MRKFLFSLILGMFVMPFMLNAQDTIVGWTFPLNDSTSLLANFGSSGNVGVRFIAAEDTGGIEREITFTNGFTDQAATATHWEDGDMVKFWSIKFKAVGYQDLKLYSKQRAGNTNAGPKYFKVQYRFSGGNYTDIPGTDTIVCGNDWTSGVLDNVALPAECNDTNISIYIRWIMLTNESISGTDVDSLGTSKIDDLFILGTPVSSSIRKNEITSVSVYPSPASEAVTIEGKNVGLISVFDMVGNAVITVQKEQDRMTLDISRLAPGMYFLKMETDGSKHVITQKLVVR